MAAEKEESGAGEMVDVVLYLFVLGPAVEWCLKSPRVNGSRPGSRRGIALAIGLLALVAAAKLGLELGQRQPNYFEVLGVRVDATPTEIKKAYKAISLKYHPDKSDDPDAHSKYMRFQSAYEVCRPRPHRPWLPSPPPPQILSRFPPQVLKDKSMRDGYNKFGHTQSVPDDSGALTQIAIFYIIWHAQALPAHHAAPFPPTTPRPSRPPRRPSRPPPFAPFPRALSPPRHVG